MKFQAFVLSALLLMMPAIAVGSEPAAAPAATEQNQPEATQPAPEAAPQETAAPVTPEAQANTDGTPAPSNDKVVGRVEKEGEIVAEKKILTYTRTEGKAEEYSNKYFTVTYTLKNNHTGHIEVLQGEVLNAVDEQIAAAEKVQKGNTSRRIGGALFRGVVGGATSFIPYAGVGMGGLYAAQATSHVVGAASNAMDSTAYNNMAIASGRYQRKINNVIIGPNNTYQITALVNKKAKPVLKVVVKDLKTNEITDIQE